MGDNYIAWARSFSLSLKARLKFVFLDGTITKPTEKKKLLYWETVHSMLVSWILVVWTLKLLLFHFMMMQSGFGITWRSDFV